MNKEYNTEIVILLSVHKIKSLVIFVLAISKLLIFIFKMPVNKLRKPI